MRRSARKRADKIHVVTIRDGDRAIAVRERSIPKEQELDELSEALQRSETLHCLAERARRLGHEIDGWLAHDQESITACTRRAARICARFDAATPVIDGEALDEPYQSS